MKRYTFKPSQKLGYTRAGTCFGLDVTFQEASNLNIKNDLNKHSSRKI